MKSVIRIILVCVLTTVWFTLSAQIPTFVVDTIYNPGDSIYRVSTGESHDVWYYGGKDSNELYQINSVQGVINYTLLYQDSSNYVITDVYNTGKDSVLISTWGGGLFYLSNGNLDQLGVVNGIYGAKYNSLLFLAITVLRFFSSSSDLRYKSSNTLLLMFLNS